MRYMVHFVITPDAGNKLDAAGGPVPVINHIKERFSPEVVYATVILREFWMVLSIDDPLVMGELTILSSQKFGSYPEFTPVLTGDELFKVLGIENPKEDTS